MKKLLFQTALLCSSLGMGVSSMAQINASLPEFLLPTVSGSANPVVRPQNAASSTMQNISFPGSGTNNLYVHSWDVFSSPAYNGIAWKRSDASGVTLSQGYMPVKYANDIDVVLYEDGGQYYVLAAYYYDDGSAASKGHYYDIYKFTAGGLAPVSMLNLLTLSPTFGRINVDANTPYGLAITWCRPGTGIFVKTAQLPGAAFGCNLLLPGTAAFQDPDICINRYSGSLALQIVYLSTGLNQIREQRLDFFNSMACATTGLTTESVVSTSATYGPPRIDCPDAYSVQKWAYVYTEYGVSGTSVSERIWSVVKNTLWSPGVTIVLVHNTAYSTTYGYQPNNPVVAYNCNSDVVFTGWMTRDNTAVLPGTSQVKYVAQNIQDNGSSAPASIASSYMMISNNPGDYAPVLAFSGQNTMMNFNGLHTAFSEYNISIPGEYSMNYKNKSCGAATFRQTTGIATAAAEANSPSVYPNPFNNTVSVRIPAQGTYELRLVDMMGRKIFETTEVFAAQENYSINTQTLNPGMYFIQISSAEHDIDFVQKIQK